MKFLRITLVVALAILGLEAADHPAWEQLQKEIKQATGEIKSIKPAELMQWNKEKKNFILVDVREPSEFSNGTIEATTFKKIPRGVLEMAGIKNNGLPIDETIVLYCQGGARGAMAGKRLQDLGFKNIVNLEGGIDQWLKEGYPIVNIYGAMKQVPMSETGIAE
jgi:rhodanese-related sulfurtransferase